MQLNLEFIVQFLGVLVVLVPFLASWLEKRNKLQKSVYLLELLKTEDQLVRLIAEKEEQSNSVVLVEKLKKLKREIEDEIHYKTKRSSYLIFISIIALEGWVFYNYFLNKFLTGKPGELLLTFLEGPFRSPEGRLFLLFCVISFSAAISLLGIPYVDKRIRNKYLANGVMIVIFHLAFGFSLVGLRVLDWFIPWF